MAWYRWKLWRLAWGHGPRKVVDGDGTWERVSGFACLYWLVGKDVPDGPVGAELGLTRMEVAF